MGRDLLHNKCIIDCVALKIPVQNTKIEALAFIIRFLTDHRAEKEYCYCYVTHNTARNTQSINVNQRGLAVVTRDYNNGVHSRLISWARGLWCSNNREDLGHPYEHTVLVKICPPFITWAFSIYTSCWLLQFSTTGLHFWGIWKSCNIESINTVRGI